METNTGGGGDQHDGPESRTSWDAQMELRVEPGSGEEFSFWRFPSKRRNPELTGGIRQHIPLALQHIEPPREDLGSLVGWRGSGERRRNQTPECCTRRNAAAVLVTYTRCSSSSADEKEINE